MRVLRNGEGMEREREFLLISRLVNGNGIGTSELGTHFMSYVKTSPTQPVSEDESPVQLFSGEHHGPSLPGFRKTFRAPVPLRVRL